MLYAKRYGNEEIAHPPTCSLFDNDSKLFVTWLLMNGEDSLLVIPDRGLRDSDRFRAAVREGYFSGKSLGLDGTIMRGGLQLKVER